VQVIAHHQIWLPPHKKVSRKVLAIVIDASNYHNANSHGAMICHTAANLTTVAGFESKEANYEGN
jgi:hypothetical protein